MVPFCRTSCVCPIWPESAPAGKSPPRSLCALFQKGAWKVLSTLCVWWARHSLSEWMFPPGRTVLPLLWATRWRDGREPIIRALDRDWTYSPLASFPLAKWGYFTNHWHHLCQDRSILVTKWRMLPGYKKGSRLESIRRGRTENDSPETHTALIWVHFTVPGWTASSTPICARTWACLAYGFWSTDAISLLTALFI